MLETHGDVVAAGDGGRRARHADARLHGRVDAGLVPLLEVPPPADFKLATYVLDFGNVIKGNQKKKIFKLKNAGWQPVSFDIDKNAISAYGLRVEPDKVVKLPGCPSPRRWSSR